MAWGIPRHIRVTFFPSLAWCTPKVALYIGMLEQCCPALTKVPHMTALLFRAWASPAFSCPPILASVQLWPLALMGCEDVFSGSGAPAIREDLCW